MLEKRNKLLRYLSDNKIYEGASFESVSDNSGGSFVSGSARRVAATKKGWRIKIIADIMPEARMLAKDNGTINHWRSVVFSNQPLSGLLLWLTLFGVSLARSMPHLSLQLNVNYLTAISCIENVIEIRSHPPRLKLCGYICGSTHPISCSNTTQRWKWRQNVLRIRYIEVAAFKAKPFRRIRKSINDSFMAYNFYRHTGIRS